MSKKRHTRKQQLVFLSSLKESLDDEFLDMEIRSRMNGIDLPTKRYIQDMDKPETDRQQALEYLWTYTRLNNMRQENLKNAVRGVSIIIENQMDAQALIDNLNEYLNQINLPEI